MSLFRRMPKPLEPPRPEILARLTKAAKAIKRLLWDAVGEIERQVERADRAEKASAHSAEPNTEDTGKEERT